jgi:O-antigen/teichoic acid export membrane protein
LILFLTKELLKKFSLRISLVVLNKFLGLLILFVLTHLLSTEEFGVYQFLLIVAMYASVISNWGFLEHGLRKIRVQGNNPSSTVSEIISLRLLLWFIGAMISLLIFLLVDLSDFSIWSLAIALLCTISLTFNIDYFYYANKKVFAPVVIHLISQLLYLVFICCFFFIDADLNLILVSLFLSRLMESFILLYKSKLRIQLVFSWQKLQKQFRGQWFLGLSNKTGYLLNTFPVMIIPFNDNFENSGFYALAYKLISLLFIVFQTINLIIAPNIVDLKSDKSKAILLFKRINLVYVLFSVLVGGGIYLFGPYLVVLIFGDDYVLVGTYLVYFAVFFLPIVALKLSATVILNNLFLDNIYFLGSFYGLVIGLCCIPTGLYLFGIIGGIISLSIATSFSVIYFYIHIRKHCLSKHNE